MYILRLGIALGLAIFGTHLGASSLPTVEQPLPPVVIADLGEVTLVEDEFGYQPWDSSKGHSKVHILQYIAGTMSAKKTFEPFTDALQETFEIAHYHVTTIVNLDAATWGTGGLVVSEVKSSKREFPLSTIVMDEEGVGAEQWGLGKKGAGLAIIADTGELLFFKQDSLSEEEISAGLAIVRAQIER